MEFFTRDHGLFVIYNNKEMSFVDFWHQEGAKEALDKLYWHLELEDAKGLRLAAGKDRRETMIRYISEHFPERKNPLDVIIRTNGSVTINKER